VSFHRIDDHYGMGIPEHPRHVNPYSAIPTGKALASSLTSRSKPPTLLPLRIQLAQSKLVASKR
jgi:hypothetical protein